MDLLLASGGDDQARHEKPGPGQRRRRRQPNVFSIEDCLVALAALPKLVALGLLSPAQANSMRGVYQTLLSHHEKQDAAPHRGAVQDKAELRQVLKENPQLANYFVGVLSDEEIEDILAADEDPV